MSLAPLSLTINPHSPVPLYYQIAEGVRGLIQEGRLKPGDPLPPDEAVAAQIGVSRQTVLRAFSDLARQGYLLRKRAQGTFVAHPGEMVPFLRGDLRSFTEEAVFQNLDLHSRILQQDTLPAPGEIARKLRIRPQEKVIRIQRLRFIDGSPIVIQTSYFPFTRFPGLASLDLTDRSIYAILETNYQCQPYEALDSFEAAAAQPCEAELLQVSPGTPVVLSERIALDAEGRPVEFTLSFFRADRFRYISRRVRGGPENIH